MSGKKGAEANHALLPKPPSVPGFWRVTVSAPDPEAASGAVAVAARGGTPGSAPGAVAASAPGAVPGGTPVAAPGGAPGAAGGKRRFWLVVSLGGARAYPDEEVDAGKPPCVYVVPESDSPEESEGMDMMPRFKLISADKAVLSGPPRNLTGDPGKDEPEYRGGAAYSTTSGTDSRDFLEAYPAPSDEPLSTEHFNCYLWSPSRESALVLSPGGGLSWNAGADGRTLMNYGTTASATVWTFRRSAAHA